MSYKILEGLLLGIGIGVGFYITELVINNLSGLVH